MSAKKQKPAHKAQKQAATAATTSDDGKTEQEMFDGFPFYI